MACRSCAHFLVGRVRDGSSRIADDDLFHSGKSPEYGLQAPEAPTSECCHRFLAICLLSSALHSPLMVLNEGMKRNLEDWRLIREDWVDEEQGH